MTKEEIYKLLNEESVPYEIVEHEAVYNMKDVKEKAIPIKGLEAKNLFLCDDKKNNYYLLIICGDKRVNLKDFRKKYNTRSLSFATEQDLFNIMKLTKGSVTPLGLLNDKELKVILYIDENFIGENNTIGVHPNNNTATIWLKVNDLIRIIKKHGNIVNIVKL